jgi:predicted enzyme related to lactoylglutathione lyase
MIRKVKFVSIPVSDEERALEFYTKRLGFEVLTDQSYGEGQRWIELGIPRAETKVVLYRPENGDGIGTFQRMAFQADDVEQTWREMKARGVEFTQDPKAESWGTAAGFKDPDGNTFVLSSK